MVLFFVLHGFECTDLPGLQAAVKDYVAFIGTKEGATAALTASGESLYSKVPSCH